MSQSLKHFSKSFEAPNGDILKFSFKMDNDNNISFLKIYVCKKKENRLVDLTSLFEDNEDLYAFTDTVIDNAINNK